MTDSDPLVASSVHRTPAPAHKKSIVLCLAFREDMWLRQDVPLSSWRNRSGRTCRRSGKRSWSSLTTAGPPCAGPKVAKDGSGEGGGVVVVGRSWWPAPPDAEPYAAVCYCRERSLQFAWWSSRSNSQQQRLLDNSGSSPRCTGTRSKFCFRVIYCKVVDHPVVIDWRLSRRIFGWKIANFSRHAKVKFWCNFNLIPN